MIRLDKWYLDAVSDRGEVAMLYWASLRRGAFALHYGAALHRPADGPPTARYTLHPGAAPESGNGTRVDWVSTRLGIQAHWDGCDPAVGRTLLSTPDGAIRWDCTLPRASASVTIGPHAVNGLGYVERLTMTLPPWRVPCDELRWGRFLSDREHLVWIDWRGQTPRTWVFADGTEHQAAEISTHAVTIADAGIHLEMGKSADLRTGTLRRTALSPLRWLVSLLPRWRHAREEKWLAAAALTTRYGTSSGWVIHERVRWA